MNIKLIICQHPFASMQSQHSVINAHSYIHRHLFINFSILYKVGHKN